MLDAANDLFAERGYDEVSVEDIARSAGVTRGLVHHYFGGRTEVYVALLERLDAIREERCGRPRVAAPARGWRTPCHAGSTGPRRTALIYLGTIAPGEDIADPEVRRAVADLGAAPSPCSRPSTPTSPRTRPGCATRWSAGPG